MPEILTQNQIDQLLNNLRLDELERAQAEQQHLRKVKDYDFRTPKKLTKEQLRVLLRIHENFARHLSSYLSGVLRTYCEISVTTIEELPYYEHNNTLGDSVMIGVFDVKPVEGSVLVDVSNSVTFSLVDRLLGGAGVGYVPEHEFTEIELSLMGKVFGQVAVYLKEAWSNLVEAEAEFQQIEINARLIQSMPTEEVVAVVLFSVAIGSVKGVMGLCVPCINLEGILDQLGKNKLLPKRQADQTLEEQHREAMLAHIKSSALSLRCELGKTRLNIRDVANLQPGDVIRLGREADSLVKVLVGEKPWFYGALGISRNRKAVKIVKII